MSEYRELTNELQPAPGEVVLIRLKAESWPAMCQLDGERGSLKVDVSVNTALAVLKFVRDRFGKLRPSCWQTIGVSTDFDRKSGSMKTSTRVMAEVPLSEVAGWTRIP